MPSGRTLIPYALCLVIGVGAGWLLFADGTSGSGLAPATESDGYCYGVSHIVIPVTPQRSESRARTQIRRAHERIVGGTDFAIVARAKSEDASAPDGGFLGFVRVDFDTNFAGAVQALEPGALSPPLRTRLGWQIIKRHTFEEARRMEEELWIPTHGFFVPWEGMPQGPAGRTREEAERLAREAKAALENGTLRLGDAAARFNPDPDPVPDAYLGMTANRGVGEIIYKALDGTKPGTIAGPVEHPNGWAVLVRGRYLRSLFRHVLIHHIGSKERDPSLTRLPATAREIAQRALDEVRADRSRWTQIVEAYSDEAFSRADRGTMGVLHPGSIPHGFERIVYDMQPGEIHPEVVESELGYHVLWRVN